MFYKSIFFFPICFGATFALAQNYIQNPGFELMDTCGAGNQAHNGIYDVLADKCLGWNSALGSPDLYATCGYPGNTGIPSNIYGHQSTHQGTKYCGAIIFLANQNYYELFCNRLLYALQPGTVYEISYYVSKPETPDWACNNFGAVFTTAAYSELSNPYTRRNFSHIRDTTIVTDETGWTRVSGIFTADSAYTFMIMGNLYDQVHTQFITGLGMPASDGSYYYFDDVCVIPLGGDCSIQVSVIQPQQGSSFTAYPNPIIKSQSPALHFSKESSVEVYDMMGQAVGHFENVVEVDAGGWPVGMYLLRESGGGITKIIVME